MIVFSYRFFTFLTFATPLFSICFLIHTSTIYMQVPLQPNILPFAKSIDMLTVLTEGTNTKAETEDEATEMVTMQTSTVL